MRLNYTPTPDNKLVEELTYEEVRATMKIAKELCEKETDKSSARAGALYQDQRNLSNTAHDLQKKGKMKPVPLQDWVNDHVIGDEMYWKGAAGSQISFVRDRLVSLAGWGRYWRETKRSVTVISTHTSKSIELPVYKIERPGLTLILRDNFHDWKLSVISETPIIADFTGMFHTTPPIAPKYTGDQLSSVYFEGFPEQYIFGYYEPSDKKKFSACIGSEYTLCTTVFLILRSLGHVKPMIWHTEETRRKSMEEDTLRDKEWEKEHGRDY